METLEKWRQIYFLANEIASFQPWEMFAEDNLFAYILDSSERHEHFFSFLHESSGQYGIAIYPSGNDCLIARQRLRNKNRKREPVFLLQNAVVLLWGDREDVSKENRALLKELGIKCRGKGNWLHMEQYRVGYAPRNVPEDCLDTLENDLGNLWMMMRAVVEGKLKPDFTNNKILARMRASDGQWYNYVSPLRHRKEPEYTRITMVENEWLHRIRSMIPKGTVELDWSYYPNIVKDGKEEIVPRLVWAVDARTGIVLKHGLLAPSPAPQEDMLAFLDELIKISSKPSVIEISDREIESYISDICRQTGIRLVCKNGLKKLDAIRREYLKTL